MRSMFLFMTMLFVVISKKSDAQIPYVDSRELILKGIELNDEKKYKEALQQYRQVHECDTNYSTVLYESALSLIGDSSFREARNVAFFGAALYKEKKRDFLLMAANALDYLNETDSALALYRELMELYPTDHQPYYECGVVYFRQKKYDTAINYFQRAIVINPNHASSHYLLGTIYLIQGRLTESMLALQTALLVTKNSNIATKVIGLLSSITQQNDEISKYFSEKKEQYNNPSFDEIDQLVNSKIALNANYKLKIGISDDIFRQLQAVCEKLKFNASDTSFSMQYYVPMFEDCFKNDHFEGLMLLAFSDFGLKLIDDYAAKRKSEITETQPFIYPYLENIQKTREVNYTRRKNTKEHFHYISSSNLILIGNITKKEDESIVIGPATWYYGDHNLYCKGDYNEKGEKNGLWTYYYHNGILMKEENYKNGNFYPFVKEYHKNGTLENVTTYNEESIAIQLEEYSYNGMLMRTRKLLHDKEVEEINYHSNGSVESKIVLLENDLKDGTYETLYDNGKVSRTGIYKNNKANGPYKKFYLSGKVSEEGSYLDGELDGAFREYYENGQLSKKCTLSNGKLEGIYEEFYENGVVSHSTMYSKNKKKGTNKSFDQAGHLYEEIAMNDFVPTSIIYYDSSGKITSEKKDPHGIYEYTLYYDNGNRASDVKINEDANRDGLNLYYYGSGAKSTETNYKNGKKEGLTTSYFRNGVKKSEEYFKDDLSDGYCKFYYGNGALSSEGWSKEGKKQSLWKSYMINGTLESEAYYLNDELNGYFKLFDETGRLEKKNIYDHDMLVGLVIYDTLGKIIDSLNFPQGNGKYRLADRFRKNAVELETDIKYGALQGPFSSSYFNGKIFESGTFKEGRRNGLSTYYFPDGKIKSKCEFVNGIVEGVREYFDKTGNLLYSETYKQGVNNGPSKSFCAGILRITYNYKNGERQGDQVYYGEDNKVAVIIKFDEGNAYGYTYMGKDGQMVPLVPLKNGTGQILAYYGNGKRSAEMNVLNGELEGSQKIYYSNGQLAEEKAYKNYLIDGQFLRYNPEGKVVNKETYLNGLQTGTGYIYDKNGELLITEPYFMGEDHGNALIKDPNSNKTRTYKYYCGKLLNIID